MQIITHSNTLFALFGRSVFENGGGIHYMYIAMWGIGLENSPEAHRTCGSSGPAGCWSFCRLLGCQHATQAEDQ